LAHAQQVIKLSTTTSTENSGLLAYPLPKFETATNGRVQVIAVGTGKALELAKNGDVDVTLVHARPSEDKFVAAGEGINRRDVTCNDFIIVGPAADPAGIKGSRDVHSSLKKIVDGNAKFISRGDNSGTDQMEKQYWKQVGSQPQGASYVSAGLGMGEVLNMAAELNATVHWFLQPLQSCTRVDWQKMAMGIMISLATTPALAADLTLYAAGSLRNAMTDLIAEFSDETGIRINPSFGPSGTWRTRIEGGDVPDIFASANLEHPQALQQQGILKRTVVFATNRLCIITAPGTKIDTHAVLQGLLDPTIRVAVATPVADPAGDYTLAMFRKADALQPGAFDVLSKKGLQILGELGKDGNPLGVIGVLQQAKADVVIAYCSYGKFAQEKVSGVTWQPFPAALDVPSQYGIATAIKAGPKADGFVQFIQSAKGRAILDRYGFGQ
jgi:molybdenum ABC transporter molybdate-binding protein